MTCPLLRDVLLMEARFRLHTCPVPASTDTLDMQWILRESISRVLRENIQADTTQTSLQAILRICVARRAILNCQGHSQNSLPNALVQVSMSIAISQSYTLEHPTQLVCRTKLGCCELHLSRLSLASYHP